MKIIWLFLFALLSNQLYSQETYENNMYFGTLATLFVYHTPSAKAEAMGRGQVANNNGDYGAYYNPALTSLSNGIKFNYSYTEVGRAKPSLHYYEVSYSNKKLGSIGLSAYHYSKDQQNIYAFKNKYSGGYYDAVYNLNYSREVYKGFYAGMNLGVFHYSNYIYNITGFPESAIDDGVTIDLGLLKKFEIISSSQKQIIQLGTALYNITNSKTSRTSRSYNINFVNSLPVIFRIGASHQIEFKDKAALGESDLFSLFTHFEYEKIINSSFDAVFKIGEEISVREIFYLRAGYYYSEVGDNSYEGGYHSEFTAGAGVNIPVSKIFNFKNPLNLKIDVSSVGPPKEPKHFYSNLASGDFSTNNNLTLGLSINYIP